MKGTDPGQRVKGGEPMSTLEIEHIEHQLIQFIDKVMEKGDQATAAEITALPQAALALAEIHKI